jgi:hypothetical protein
MVMFYFVVIVFVVGGIVQLFYYVWLIYFQLIWCAIEVQFNTLVRGLNIIWTVEMYEFVKYIWFNVAIFSLFPYPSFLVLYRNVKLSHFRALNNSHIR